MEIISKSINGRINNTTNDLLFSGNFIVKNGLIADLDGSFYYNSIFVGCGSYLENPTGYWSYYYELVPDEYALMVKELLELTVIELRYQMI